MYRTGENFGLLTFIAKRKGRKAEMVKEWLQSRKEERREEVGNLGLLLYQLGLQKCPCFYILQ